MNKRRSLTIVASGRVGERERLQFSFRAGDETNNIFSRTKIFLMIVRCWLFFLLLWRRRKRRAVHQSERLLMIARLRNKKKTEKKKMDHLGLLLAVTSSWLVYEAAANMHRPRAWTPRIYLFISPPLLGNAPPRASFLCYFLFVLFLSRP